MSLICIMNHDIAFYMVHNLKKIEKAICKACHLKLLEYENILRIHRFMHNEN